MKLQGKKVPNGVNLAEETNIIKTTNGSIISRGELLEKILSNIPSLIYVRDINLKFIMVNAAFENLFNRPSSEIIGKTDFDLYPKEMAEKMASDDIEVITTDKPKLNIEESLRLPDGRNIWVIANKMPLHDKNGKVIGIMGITYDINNIKMAAIQLETILDSFPYKAWLKDKEGLFVAVNELLAKSIHKSKVEMIGKTDLDIYPKEYAKKFIEDDLKII